MQDAENKNQVKSFDGITPRGVRRPVSLTTIMGEPFTQPVLTVENRESEAQSQPEVADNKKRLFLRVAGLAGIGGLAAMLLPKKAQAYVLGGAPTSAVVGIKDANNTRMTPAQESGGNLDQINANTASLLNATAGAYVQQNTTTPTFALESNGNLAAIEAQSNLLSFDSNTAGAANLKVNLAAMVPGGLDFGVQNAANQTINPATLENQLALNSSISADDSITYLRRMVRQLDSSAVVDSQQRQKITIDSFSAGVALPTVTTVTTVTTVSTVTSVTAVTSLNQLNGVDPKYLFMDTAHNSYANSIRPNLVWSSNPW